MFPNCCDQRVMTSHDTAAYVTSKLAYLATNAAPDLSSTRVNTNNPEAVRRAIAYYLGTDRDPEQLSGIRCREAGQSFTMLPSWIDGKAFFTPIRILSESDSPTGPISNIVADAKFRQQLRMVYNPPTVYDVRMPLQVEWRPSETSVWAFPRYF